MLRKLNKIIILGCVIAILFLSGCTSNEENTDNNGSSENDNVNDDDYSSGDDSEELDVPLYSGLMDVTSMVEDTLWTEMDVSLEMDNKAYSSNDEVDTIYNWYLLNYGEWELHSFSPTSSESLSAYLRLKNGDSGIFIFIMDDKMNPAGGSVIGIAQGTWTQASSCGSTKDDMDDSFSELGGFTELGNGPITFTMTPLNADAYTTINPLGALDPSNGHVFPTDHGAFWLTHSTGSTPVDDVKVPADGLIIEIFSRQQSGYEDYRVIIAHTNGFWSYMDHLSALDESILSQIGTINAGEEKRLRDSPITVIAGQIIGKTGGSNGNQRSMNWGVLDESETLNYINPDRYNRYAFAVHFIPYCQEDLKEELLGKIGSAAPYTYQRTADPLWGKVDFDESGKLVGNWFLEGIDESDPMAYPEKHLSFVYDIWDPTQIRVGIGGTLDVTPIGYIIDGNSPDPADVTTTTGQIIYRLQGTEQFGEQSIKATILVEMVESDKVKIEGFSGWQNSPSFTTNAKYYIR